MKFISSPNINHLAIAAILVAAGFSATNALADNIEWSGATSTQFSTGANWVGGVRPGAADIGTFSAASYPNQPGYTTDVATQAIGGLSFGDGVNPSGAVTLNVNNSNLNIGSSGIVINPFAGAVTITTSSAYRLRANGNQTWTNNSSNSLTVSGGSWGNGPSGSSTLTLAGTGNFIFNSAARNAAVGSELAITVSTTGTVTFNGANNNTGATNITAGTLVLGSSGSLSTTSTISVGASGILNVAAKNGFVLASGQTLTGNGKIIGDISIGLGTLAIGNSPGTMTFDDDLSFSLNSVANFEVNGFSLGEYDLALGGSGVQAVDFDGTLNIAFQAGFSTIGSVKLFDFESYGGSFADVNFTGLAAGYSASFDDLTGTVAVIPEPSTWALFAGSLAALAILRRRRRA